MLKIPDFTRPEIEKIKREANFTMQEAELFVLRNDEKSLEVCAEMMSVSISTVKRINKKMIHKIIKVI